MKFQLQDIDEAVALILPQLQKYPVIAFEGEMGAGKTTLITSLCKKLGVDSEISSPTFSIVNEYRAKNQSIYHFDFYRIDNEQDAYQIGLEEYLDSGNLCLLEWAERVPNFLPLHYLIVEIEVQDEITRQLHFREV
jgi:tRNA threonylcarbamoyladenosine biosynthesis protein TsaE